MTCQTCEELREEIAYLKGELGTVDDTTAVSKLCRAFRIAPAAGRMLYRLYCAKGRAVAHWMILELLSPEHEESRLPQVYASRLRKAIGPGSVINVWAEGYRLSPDAIARVSDILSARQIAPPAQGDKQ